MGKLGQLMGKAKLTTKELSQMTGISIKSLYDYQRGRRMPSLKGYNALCGVFGWEREKPKEKKPVKKQVRYVPRKIVIEDAPPLPKPVKYEFEEGHMYQISEKTYAIDIFGQLKGSTKWGEEVFRYEGKQGIHHCFREVRGGWTRTYTDAQLVGKHIKEE
ncbi:MAG: helix-turn-helix transcriptional regulator [Synergistaceae bacterium]|nr:helix-turn-helix transcriptional regulator [Synergistaceae bacterium]